MFSFPFLLNSFSPSSLLFISSFPFLFFSSFSFYYSFFKTRKLINNGRNKIKGEEERNNKEVGQEESEAKDQSFLAEKLKKEGKKWKDNGFAEPLFY